LIAGLSDPASARHDPAALAAAGRRLAAIDPNRAGIGGLRFQLELAMFAGTPASAGVTPSVPVATRQDLTPAVVTRPQSKVEAPTAAPAEPIRPAETEPRASPATDDKRPYPAVKVEADKADADAGATASNAPTITTETPPAAGNATGPTASPAPAPASTSAVAAASPPAGGTREAALAEVLAAWPAIVERLSAHPPTKPLIVSCRPVAVDGAIVTLGFPEEQAFLKDQAERRKPGIEAGIAAVIGRPVTVHCVVANVELPPAASDDLVAEARRIFAEELADVGEVS
jgi:hypothetical protein